MCSFPFIKKILILGLILLLSGATQAGFLSDQTNLSKLLPDVSGWSLSSQPEFYGPENLFEYIDGASEAYLAYDFRGLLVAQYHRTKEEGPLLTVEIYDMGKSENAFGIYSLERPDEGNFFPIGLEGYLEQGALQFFVGHYYVKILCFLSSEQADKTAVHFAQEIVKLIPEKGAWPKPISLFPASGLKVRTIKFILKNFLGYPYLHHGYQARYEREGVVFDAFIIQAQEAVEAEALATKWKKDLGSSSERVEEINSYFHSFNKYFQHIYFSRYGSFIFGLMRLAEGKENVALAFLDEMISSVSKAQQK